MNNTSPRSGLLVWPNSACLISKLADEVAGVRSDLRPQLSIILPTKRLEIYLLAILAKKLVSFRPPSIMNLENFVFDRAREHLSDLKISSELTERLLLTALIKKNKYRHLREGHENEIRQFFSELSETMVGEKAFDKIRAVLQNDIYRSEGHLHSLEDRVIELENLYHNFYQALGASGFIPRYEAAREKCLFLAKSWENASKLPDTFVYVAGFTSVTKSAEKLFQVMSAKENVSFWFSESPEIYGQENPLQDLIDCLDKSHAITSSAEKAKAEQHISIHEAPSVISETKAALEMANNFLQQGLSPSQIGILVPDESTYGPLIHTLFQEIGLKGNLAVPLPLSRTLLGSWIYCLARLVTTEESNTAILQFLSHPVTASWSESKKGLPSGKSRLTFVESLIKEMIYTNHLCGIKDLKDKLSTNPDGGKKNTIKSLINVLEFLQKDLSPLLSGQESRPQKPLTDWIDSFSQILNKFGCYAGENSAGLDEKLSVSNETILTAIQDFFSTLKETPVFSSTTFSGREFFELVQKHLLSLDIRSSGEPFSGFQVISFREARYVPFSAVIILGAVEGSLPQRLPSDNIIDQFFKNRIGLRSPNHLESLEDLTFKLLKSRVPRIVLFYPVEQLGEPTVRSRFIEQLIAEDHVPVERLESVPSSSIQEKTADLNLKSDHPAKFKGDASTLFSSMSATSLEKLIRCPYSFLLHRYKVESTDLPQEDDHRAEGDYLHLVLEAFFAGIKSEEICYPPLYDCTVDSDFASFAENRLNELTNFIFPRWLQKKPLYFHLRNHAWPALSRHWSLFLAPDRLKQTKRNLKEAKIGDLSSRINIGETTASLSGCIDSIDFIGDNYLITDYKRRDCASVREVREGLSPQLNLYALALEQAQISEYRISPDKGAVGYWNIIDGKWEPRGVGAEAREMALNCHLISKNTVSLEKSRQNTLDLWFWRQKNLVSPGALFLADPSFCGYCPYDGICRKNDVSWAETINSQTALKEYLASKTAGDAP